MPYAKEEPGLPCRGRPNFGFGFGFGAKSGQMGMSADTRFRLPFTFGFGRKQSYHIRCTFGFGVLQLVNSVVAESRPRVYRA